MRQNKKWKMSVESYVKELMWLLGLIQKHTLIILIILCIIVMMRLLRQIGFLGLLEWLLTPVLPYFGMGVKAAPITVVGMIAGIGYGGAFITREAAQEKLGRLITL